MPDIQLDEEIRHYFHLFWDNFPFPVMLNRKDRTILECNKAAKEAGIVLGTRCIDRGTKELHKGCLADQALRKQTSKRMVAYLEPLKIVMDSYWVPLSGYPDLYIHFGIDITDYVTQQWPISAR
jgi:hypothetical protein